MGTVYRFKVLLSGWIGGPGQNTWHMCQAGELGGADESDLEGMATDIAAVYNAIQGYIVGGIAIDLSPVVEGFDIATGQLLSVSGITPPSVPDGGGTQKALSRATQATMRLKTDAIRGNRVLQGRHFLGPITADSIGDDGQVTATVQTVFRQAYGGVTDIAGDARLVVWGQPNPKVPALSVGKIGYVQSVLTNSVPGTLRSRKV